MKVRIIYDPGFQGLYKEYTATVIKITPRGFFRIATEELNKDGKPVYNELFAPYPSYARGWNTLRWVRLK